MTAEDVFTEHRGLLFSIAYEITGSVADSEDVLQDSFMRWAGTDRAAVDNPRAYAAQIVTRQALNSLRSARRRREEYVGPWLPEPVLTVPDASGAIELAESVSLAMLLVLETLSPLERAVFVMREVFGFDHVQIAETVDRREDTVRQIAHRAREHVRARRRRFTPAGEEANRVVVEFLAAATTGNVDTLLQLLAPDVVYIADGGGKATAARVPVIGAARVARLFGGLVRHPLPDMRIEAVPVGNMPGLLVYSGEELDLVLQFEIDNDLITGVYVVRNPDKLAHLGAHPGAAGAI
ncbi:RNA polymerase sigma-70 factor [Rhodococcus sp. NPDC060084]|uniref:RNA polymerase sigma-70 factor n=1 Tax=Rhodococcus sp. NPDC060084 TaxID=3347053 RepID=UPI00364CFAE2